MIQKVGAGEESKSMLQRQNCKSSAACVDISEHVMNEVISFYL